MAEITAAAVKALRERTGLPMMDCKRALEEAGGDAEGAIEILRKAGKKSMEKRSGRETSSGRIAIDARAEVGVGTMVELLCESAPVAANDQFVQLAHDLARQLATGPGAATPDTLLDQPSPSQAGETLRQQFEDLNNRIREVFKVNRIARIDAGCAGYVHHNGSVGVLLQYEGGNPELAKDICMHVAAMRPSSVSVQDLDPELVNKEREIQKDIARQEGKPENIIEKMIEGRMRNFYAERCLLEQPFVKDDKQTVGQVAKAAGMKVVRFVHWEVGKE
jgi:elongation factor Ts